VRVYEEGDVGLVLRRSACPVCCQKDRLAHRLTPWALPCCGYGRCCLTR